jgi:hypothetical protein
LRILKSAGVAVKAVAVAATLVGCSQSASSSAELPLSAPSPSYTGTVPGFSGPWAAEFAEAYRSTTSDVVHQILTKGSITDQDYAAVSSAYVKCMANKGFTVHITGPAGQGVIDGDGDSAAADKACNGDISVISTLRFAISRNPQHLDENEIVVACLAKKQIAPPSYTAKDYEANLQSQKFPFSTSAPGFMQCTSDPLGLSSQQ